MWIGLLLFSTYTNEHTVFTESTTVSAFMNESLRPLTLSATLVLICLLAVIYFCRIIQIVVILEERGQYKGFWKAMVLCYSISGCLGALFFAATVIQLRGTTHGIFGAVACLSLLFEHFCYFTLTFKERWILYKETGRMYAADVIIGILDYIVIMVSGFIFFIYYAIECDDEGSGEECTMSPFPNFMEWLGLICTAFIPCIVSSGFYYDPKAYLQIKKWWMSSVEK